MINLKYETERLVLRPWNEDDAESLYQYAKDPAVGPIAGWPVHTSVDNSRDIIKYVLSADETYAVCLKEDNRAIGSIGLIPPAQTHIEVADDEVEIGYWIGVPFWGNGLIPEAIRRLQEHAFVDLGCSAMWCGYYDGNEKSRRCQEKCGFIYHHTEINKPCTLMGDVRTEHFTRLSKEDWKKQNMINLVALPCLCVDVFDGTNEIRPGGEALNFAAHASSFDKIDVTLLGAVGDDDYAKCIFDTISDKRINTKHIRIEPNKRTANNKTYLTEEGDRYYKEDSWDGEIVDKMLLNQDEMRVLADVDAVFVHFWAGCFKQIIEAKQKYNFKLAVDFDTYRNFSDMEHYAAYIDYFMISGEESLLHHFEEFSKKYDGLFNMTLAEKGSVTYYKGERYEVPAYGVDNVIDTTGCGDSYHAGFVCSHLIDGDITMAMKKGAELAAETLGHYGGF